jgi:chromosome segregation ATPase
MINNILNNSLNVSSRSLSEAKEKVIAASKKRATEQFGDQIPSVENFKTQLDGIAAENQDNLQEVEKFYNEIIKKIDKVILNLESSKKELLSIKNKLSKITDQFNFLEEVSDFIRPLVSFIKDVVLRAADAILASSSGPIANGLLINKIGEKKKDLKDLLSNAESSLDSIPDANSYFESEISNINGPVNKGIEQIDIAIIKLKELKQLIISLYQQFIEGLILPQLNPDENGYTELTDNLSDYLLDEDNLSTILSDAVNVGLGENISDRNLIFKRFVTNI